MKDQIARILMLLLLVGILLIAGTAFKLVLDNNELQSEIAELEEEKDTIREAVQDLALDYHGALAAYRDKVTDNILFMNKVGKPCRAYGRE